MSWERTIAMGAWLVAAGTGCDGGPDYVQPRVGDVSGAECASFECAIALGSTVDADAYVGTDYTEYAEIASATVEPATLADVTSDGHAFALIAKAEGTGVLRVVTTRDTTIVQPIRVAALASTTVELVGVPRAVDPGGAFDVIGAPTLVATSVHRDATGARLLGHGFETWTAIGAELSELTAGTPRMDAALVRNVTLVAPSATIFDGDAALELASVPVHSTTRLALAVDRYVLPGTASVSVGETAGFDVLAFAADDRFIINAGLASASTSDTSIATAVPSRYSPVVNAVGHAVGHATLTIELDGARADVDVEVPR